MTLKEFWLYEVTYGTPKTTFFADRHTTQAAAVAAFNGELIDYIASRGRKPDYADLRRRRMVEDPECRQDSARCPCGPVGEWELVRRLFG